MMAARGFIWLAAGMSGLFLNACSLNKLAMNKVAGMLSTPSANDVFMSDNDPELVGDALPFAIKFYESLLASMPEHEGLRLRTGSLYIMYANAFLQTPADMTPKNETDTREDLLARAKNLYLRGRDILIAALEKKNPALRRQLKERKYKEATAPYQSKDIALLYWTAAGWIGAFAIDPFDMKFAVTLPQAAALMDRAQEIDPNYGRGAIHNFYILYYGSLPDYMGGDVEKAREHFDKAIALSRGTDTSAYVALAQTVCVKKQDVESFKNLLQKVLELDPDEHPETRLVNILNQRKARWLLAHIDEYFLLEEQKDNSEDQEDRS
jgi:predicted anti-sigma-YlaC factor YlaD